MDNIENSNKEQSAIKAWHQLGDAYVEAYEERQISSYVYSWNNRSDISEQTKSADMVDPKIKELYKKCKHSTNLCGGQEDTRLFYLSDQDALKAIELGMPVGFRDSRPGYHGSDAGLYHFTMVDTPEKFNIFKNSIICENSAAYFYALSDEDIQYLNSKLNNDKIQPMVSYTIRADEDPFGANVYFGYKDNKQYTDAEDTIYELLEHNPEFAKTEVIENSSKKGYISDSDYVDAALIVMTAEEKEAHIEAVEMAMDWNDTHEPAVPKADYLLYEQLVQERANANGKNAADMIDFKIEKLYNKCKSADNYCGNIIETKLYYLSEEDALNAITAGMPIGFRSAYENFDDGSYRFTLADSPDKYFSLLQDPLYENVSAFHFSLNDEEIKYLNDRLRGNHKSGTTYTIHNGKDLNGDNVYFGYKGNQQYTGPENSIYDLLNNNPEYASLSVINASVQRGTISIEDYVNANIAVMDDASKLQFFKEVRCLETQGYEIKVRDKMLANAIEFTSENLKDNMMNNSISQIINQFDDYPFGSYTIVSDGKVFSNIEPYDAQERLSSIKDSNAVIFRASTDTTLAPDKRLYSINEHLLAGHSQVKAPVIYKPTGRR